MKKMKKAIFLASLITIVIISACNNSTKESNKEQNFSLDTTKVAQGVSYYQCPMHPEVISDKSGNCPKCGMDLEKTEKK